jgi:NADH-quinone oxidoreductase subunit N
VTAADLLALAPILILALGSAAVLLIGAWFPRCVPLLWGGAGIALAAALTAAFYSPPTLEIAGFFRADGYGRFFTVLWSTVAALSLMTSLRYAEERDFEGGEYAALVLFGAAGMALLSSAVSFVGFFLGLEAFTLVLYILIAFHRENPLGAEAGLKYLVLGAVATGFLAFGIALIYTASGTFRIAEAMASAMAGEMRPIALAGMAMFLVAVGFKVSLVPFHLWTPDVYQGAPAPVTGLLSTGSKGAVFAALVTMWGGVAGGRDFLDPLLWGLAALTMLVGTFCALRQENLKRLLAYSSVVHMGYVLIGLLAGGPDGHGAVVFYLVAYTVVNLGAFGIIASLSGSEKEPQDLEDFRGLGYRHPLRCGTMAVFLFSLAGVPPTAGFIGKFGIFYAAIGSGFILLALLGVVASLISLYYYLRVIIVMFMSEIPAPPLHRGNFPEKAAVGLCLLATLWFGLAPGPLLDLIARIVL